jgi:hypothetical protein
MSGHDEFGEELKREWFAGRAQQIHAELKADFDRYIKELHAPRMRQVLEAAGIDADDADQSSAAAANTISTAEGVLVAMAVYLARQEANTPKG